MANLEVRIESLEERTVYGLWKKSNDRTIKKDIDSLSKAYPDFVIVSPKILHQRVWRFSDALPSTWFGCKPPCSEVA